MLIQICVCLQEMSSAVITYCGHFFHDNCLRKWLYVQETCPMCHQTVRPVPPGQSQASDDGTGLAAAAQRDARPDPAAQFRHQNMSNGTMVETQLDDVTPNSTLQRDERESFGNDDSKGEPDKVDRKAAQSNSFSSSGDFQFVNPVSPESPPWSPIIQTSPLNMYSHGEVNGEDSNAPSLPAAMSESTGDIQSNRELLGFKNVPPHFNHDRTPNPCHHVYPPGANHRDKDHQAVSGAVNLVDSSPAKSFNGNSELSTDSSNNHHACCTSSNSDIKSDPRIYQLSSEQIPMTDCPASVP